MMVSINNAVQANWIFIIVFIIALAVSARKKEGGDPFPPSLTDELKGLAILAVVFFHISYLLVGDYRFLYPLNIIAGVGVNLFLFLSGYWLTASGLKKDISVWQFYKHRFLKLLKPFWLVLAIFFILDFLFLKINYSWPYIAHSVIGFFPSADINTDVNGPFWYLTLILFYYLIFPLVFSKKFPFASAIFLYLAGYFIVRWNPALLADIIHLYKVHFIAFPLGMLAGWIFYKPNFINIFISKISARLLNSKQLLWQAGYYVFIAGLIAVICYYSIHSGVGESADKEQMLSIVVMSAIVILFLFKKFEFKLLCLFGFYSYEIYLFHWPLMYRYDFIYKFLPAWLATIIYLAVFIGLGWVLKKIAGWRIKKIQAVR